MQTKAFYHLAAALTATRTKQGVVELLESLTEDAMSLSMEEDSNPQIDAVNDLIEAIERASGVEL